MLVPNITINFNIIFIGCPYAYRVEMSWSMPVRLLVARHCLRELASGRVPLSVPATVYQRLYTSYRVPGYVPATVYQRLYQLPCTSGIVVGNILMINNRLRVQEIKWNGNHS